MQTQRRKFIRLFKQVIIVKQVKLTGSSIKLSMVKIWQRVQSHQSPSKMYTKIN